MADEKKTRVIRVWADSVRPATCKGETCAKPIFFAQNVNTGKEMPFDGPEPVALKSEHIDGRLALSLDFDTNHFGSCVDRAKFSRK